MSLKTLVKVSGVTNLSDARYCAGMGVEMIGFGLDENHPKFIELAKLREISVWISGIKVVGEFNGDNLDNVNYLSHEIPLDFVQLNHLPHLKELNHIKNPIILKLDIEKDRLAETEEAMQKYFGNVTFFLLESFDHSIAELEAVLKKWCENYNIIIGFGINSESLPAVLNTINPKGIGLHGGHEIKPGLKNFEHLADILELLEED